MDHLFGAGVAGFLALCAVVFVVVLVVCWIVLPFAIVGTKPVLREILAAIRENNRLLREGQEQRAPTTPLYKDKAPAR